LPRFAHKIQKTADQAIFYPARATGAWELPLFRRGDAVTTAGRGILQKEKKFI
jgi:hypothetical protein